MSIWKALLGCVLVVCVVALQITYAQRSSGSALSAEDYVEIQQLMARFAHALDTAANDGQMFADLFAPDGAFGAATGRAQLASLARNGRASRAGARHFATNVIIRPSAQGATGTQYEILFEIGKDGKQSTIASTGRYEDTYVKTPQGWRFQKRELMPSIITSEATKAAVPEAPAAGAQPAIVVDPQRTGTKTSLTALDYVQIQQLVASYGHALDNGLGRPDNGDAYASLFTTDGVAFRRLRGFGPLASIARAQPHGPRYVRHVLTNVTIAPSPEGATGEQYLVVIDPPEGGKPGALFLGGHYEDIYVKAADGWRFKSRTLFNARSGVDAEATPPSEPVPPAVRVAAGGAGTSRLTAGDYVEIQQLVARYGFALDTGANNGYAYADLYTSDGAFGTTKGREKLAELARGGKRGPLHVRNYSSNAIIQPSAEGATGIQYAQAIDFEPGGRAGLLDHYGRYEDVYVKTPQGWRFKSRLFVNESQAALGTAPTRTAVGSPADRTPRGTSQ